MTTSVKLLERDKQRPGRLQREIMARQGRRVAQQASLSWLLDLGEAENHRQSLDLARPMSAREIAALNRLTVRTGVTTHEEYIDATVARAVR